MRCATLAAVLLLAACAHPEPIKPSASVLVPPAVQVCPDGVTPPKPPPTPRTIPDIIGWSEVVFDAWWRTELARHECARRLTVLNQWVDDHLMPDVIDAIPRQ
jgi:hypothetical protein